MRERERESERESAQRKGRSGSCIEYKVLILQIGIRTNTGGIDTVADRYIDIYSCR